MDNHSARNGSRQQPRLELLIPPGMPLTKSSTTKNEDRETKDPSSVKERPKYSTDNLTDNLTVLDPDKLSLADIERSILETHRRRGTLVQFESALIEKTSLFELWYSSG
jgi:hypothetical protein